jgi:hypothetical protein
LGAARRGEHAGALSSARILAGGELEAVNDVPCLALTNLGFCFILFKKMMQTLINHI